MDESKLEKLYWRIWSALDEHLSQEDDRSAIYLDTEDFELIRDGLDRARRWEGLWRELNPANPRIALRKYGLLLSKSEKTYWEYWDLADAYCARLKRGLHPMDALREVSREFGHKSPSATQQRLIRARKLLADDSGWLFDHFPIPDKTQIDRD